MGDKVSGIQNRRNIFNALTQEKPSFLSVMEHQNFTQANHDEHWIKATNDDMHQIEKNQIWECVPRPKGKNVTVTKWVYRNKINEDGQVVMNKERFVCNGYVQVEGIDFDETFSQVARIEAI